MKRGRRWPAGAGTSNSRTTGGGVQFRPRAEGCEECLKSGDYWGHLRLCLTGVHAGCCNDSPNKHATRHFHDTGHPVVKSFDPDEEWAWC